MGKLWMGLLGMTLNFDCEEANIPLEEFPKYTLEDGNIYFFFKELLKENEYICEEYCVWIAHLLVERDILRKKIQCLKDC